MNLLPAYETRILPALRQIQARHRYLKREALEQLARDLNLPLHRIQTVASFYPHFRLAPPAPVTVKVCRNMACHMAGSADLIATMARTCGDRIRVEGASCLGRCDQAPAATVTIGVTDADGAVREEEHNYHGRSAKALKAIVDQCLAACDGQTKPPKADHDADRPHDPTTWRIDPYQAIPGDATPPPEPYAALRSVVAARGASIDRAAAALRDKYGWTRERTDRFSVAAARRGLVDFPLDDELRDAVREWQTDRGRGKGPDMGGWSDAFLAELDDAHADLRGMGGAGIPATQKWRDVRDAVRTARRRRQNARAYVVVNGDESEPGTFKDRELLLRAPHLIVEAVVIAGLITGATEGFIYIRHEYHEQIEACEREIERAAVLGLCGEAAQAIGRPFRVSVFVSPGGYICGEQSALIEAMSDRRSEPRNLPPKLETNGLDDRPTLVSNVETFAWVPFILLRGGQAYADLGQNTWKGRRFFSVSGDVVRPGVYEVPMGTTLRELVHGERYCQGMRRGLPLKAIAPSGPSGGFLPARLAAGAGLPRDHANNKAWQELAARRGIDSQAQSIDVLDLELELNLFRAISPTQALGAGIVVYANGRDMAAEAVNAIEFYRDESCGKCVPCRIGSQKLATLGRNLLAARIERDRWNAELQPALRELGKVMELSSICGLGRSVPLPLRTVMEFFRADLEKHLTGPNTDALNEIMEHRTPGVAAVGGPAERGAAVGVTIGGTAVGAAAVDSAGVAVERGSAISAAAGATPEVPR